MFRRTLLAIAAVGFLTTVATAPAYSGIVVKQITGYTPSHQPPSRRVQGRFGKPQFEDIKPQTGMGCSAGCGQGNTRLIVGGADGSSTP